MEDVSDLPFRVICKIMGADIVYTEFIASEGIIRNAKKANRKMIIHDYERPTAVQIFGSDFDSMIESAKIVEDAGADILDINFGCWVKKVVNREAGAAFLKQPERMAELTNKLANAISIPLTVKTRLGWDKYSIRINEVAKMIEDAGAKALAIHCRTRADGMGGSADWSYLIDVKKNANIPIILNGDIRTHIDAKNAFEMTKCDAVMIGRGCIGYPFVFKEIQDYLNTNIEPSPPDIKFRIETCLKHLKLNFEYKGDHGIIEFRKHYSGYLKGYYDASATRQKIMKCKEYKEIEDILYQYLQYLEDNNKLEPISSIRHKVKLSCESESYIKKQVSV